MINDNNTVCNINFKNMAFILWSYFCVSSLYRVRTRWCGGVVVICSPHDPEVPSSNTGKNNTSDFSIRDPLSLPSCD